MSLFITGCASATRIADHTSSNQTESQSTSQGSSSSETSALALEEFYQEDPFEEGRLLEDDSDLESTAGTYDETIGDDTSSDADDRDFCRHDIYAQHLIRKYKENKVATEKSPPISKTKKRRGRKPRFTP